MKEETGRVKERGKGWKGERGSARWEGGSLRGRGTEKENDRGRWDESERERTGVDS